MNIYKTTYEVHCVFQLEVQAPRGTAVGYVMQDWHPYLPKFTIRDERKRAVLRIVGPFCDCNCCSDVIFKVLCAAHKRQVTVVQLHTEPNRTAAPALTLGSWGSLNPNHCQGQDCLWDFVLIFLIRFSFWFWYFENFDLLFWHFEIWLNILRFLRFWHFRDFWNFSLAFWDLVLTFWYVLCFSLVFCDFYFRYLILTFWDFWDFSNLRFNFDILIRLRFYVAILRDLRFYFSILRFLVFHIGIFEILLADFFWNVLFFHCEIYGEIFGILWFIQLGFGTVIFSFSF